MKIDQKFSIGILFEEEKIIISHWFLIFDSTFQQLSAQKNSKERQVSRLRNLDHL